MDTELRNALRQALSVTDDRGAREPRLLDDAQRLWERAQRLLQLELIASAADRDAIELACYALQLPLRQPKPGGRIARATLRDRAEQAAELLVSTFGELADESLLDRTTRLLQELPQRSPVLDEAKLLADAVNLEDFGVSGLLLQAMGLARLGEGLSAVADGAVKREEYGYWEARLKDGFHFQPVREIAQRRLGSAREVSALLLKELGEDQPA